MENFKIINNNTPAGPVESQQWTPQNNMSNMFKVNNKDARNFLFFILLQKYVLSTGYMGQSISEWK